MDWQTIIREIIIALITTSFGSLLSYKKAIKESNNKIEEVKITSENEIKKIKEESKKEIAKIEAECLAKIKEKDEEMKNEATKMILENPDKLDDLLKLYKKAKNFKN